MKLAFYGRKMRHFFCNTAVIMGVACAPGAFAQDAQLDDLMVVFDASGSMWGQVDGTAKIEIARDVFVDISKGWTASDRAVGLIAYGHRRKGDCGDIEILAEPSIEGAASLADVVADISPRGKTPLSQAVRMAAETLRFTENAATVVLLSDGKETCDLDPCAVGAELEQLGVDFTAHVIGFDIQEEADRAQLQCLAQNTGGTYVDARDAATLTTALTEVTGRDVTTAPADTETGTTKVNLNIAVADGTARPATVRLSAVDAETGETQDLGVLDGADQIISGVTLDLPQGDWTFTANGDGGTGEITASLNKTQQEISIPFVASNATFDFIGADTFTTDGTIAFQLRSREPLQQNATYSVMLFPDGATTFEENITFSYRFGTDPETTEHAFYPWEFDLPVGDYEVVIMGDSYDLGDNLGRFSVQLVATLEDNAPEANAPETDELAAPPSFALSQIAEPLSPGMSDAFLLEGPVEAGDQVMFIGLDGQDTQMLTLPQSGIVAVPPQIADGAFRIQLVRQDGSDIHLGLIDILAASAQDIGNHSTGGEPSDTMLSAEELAAETGPQSLSFEPWKTCEQDAACRVSDRRVELEWMMPSGWASEEPFYYTTASGAQADHPTMRMGRATGGAFSVVLNPRQWDTQLGPCEEIQHGLLCRETSDVLKDQTDYELIRNSLNGDFPKPEGWLPIGRSWTIEDRNLGVRVGLIKFDEPIERAETVSASIRLDNPDQFGLSENGIVQTQLGLIWDQNLIVNAIDGEIAVGDGSLFLLLARPGGWDGTSNVWVGNIANPANGRAVLVNLY
ncbi:VWA domain-containing protein [Phaeobacter inhibens]|uniref:vWA domain-containing protein n=1 Tax=Phaeobacter inhibens TaxID=221822 RepID=UPI0026E2A05E|nr:VWA domain-containing protein [Phaeobacter inhibens]MDO6758027.1 VWA domain-containing protein [Phaeobacter inhibens]